MTTAPRTVTMDLGDHYPCLDVADLAASMDFYRKLDFRIVQDHSDGGWAVLQNGRMALCLFQGHIERNLMNFRGGDVQAIHDEAVARGLEFVKPAWQEPDGSWGAELRDPDGNVLYFNTDPGEREVYARTGRLIDDPA